jgi:hypothetical protein
MMPNTSTPETVKMSYLRRRTRAARVRYLSSVDAFHNIEKNGELDGLLDMIDGFEPEDRSRLLDNYQSYVLISVDHPQRIERVFQLIDTLPSKLRVAPMVRHVSFLVQAGFDEQCRTTLEALDPQDRAKALGDSIPWLTEENAAWAEQWGEMVQALPDAAQINLLSYSGVLKRSIGSKLHRHIGPLIEKHLLGREPSRPVPKANPVRKPRHG